MRFFMLNDDKISVVQAPDSVLFKRQSFSFSFVCIKNYIFRLPIVHFYSIFKKSSFHFCLCKYSFFKTANFFHLCALILIGKMLKV